MNLICAICLERFTSNCDVLTTPCGHLFHNACLARSFTGIEKTCPSCRHVCIQNIHKVFLQCDSSDNTLHQPLQRPTSSLRPSAPAFQPQRPLISTVECTQQSAQQNLRQSAQQNLRQSAAADQRIFSELTAEEKALLIPRHNLRQSSTADQRIFSELTADEKAFLINRTRPSAPDRSWQPGMPRRPQFLQPPQVTPQSQPYQQHPDVVGYAWSDY